MLIQPRPSPGATGWIPLDSYWFTRSTLPVPGGPIQWSTEGQPNTPYVQTPGLVSGKCINEGPRVHELRTVPHHRKRRYGVRHRVAALRRRIFPGVVR